jgi:hypothetical protein
MGLACYVSVWVQLYLLASRQTHTQGNNKNNEGKQHRNKTQMENMQSVTT